MMIPPRAQFICFLCYFILTPWTVNAWIDCACPYTYYPLCGSDGVTYNNKCLFKCARDTNGKYDLKIVSDGICGSDAWDDIPFNMNIKTKKPWKTPECPCHRVRLPVCGSNGVTYSNLCRLKCERNKPGGKPALRKLYDGKCQKKNLVYMRSVQGAGSTMCISKCPSNDLYREARKPRSVAPSRTCVCHKNYSPVCGSDGATYGNECQLNCKRDKSDGNPDLYAVSQGECEGNRLPNMNQKANFDETHLPIAHGRCAGVQINDPVCGSDGVSYPSILELECTRDKLGKPDLHEEHRGECEGNKLPAINWEAVFNESSPVTIIDGPCAGIQIYFPVCGSDGVTYPGLLEFECLRDKLGKETELNVASLGPCKDPSTLSKSN